MFAFVALPSFLAGQGLGLAVGFVAGAFTPSIGRYIKSLFVKEAGVVKADVSKEAQTVAQDISKKL